MSKGIIGNLNARIESGEIKLSVIPLNDNIKMELGKSGDLLNSLDCTDLFSEYLDLIEKSKKQRRQLNIINKQIDLIVEIGLLNGINLIDKYSKL